MSSPLYTVGSMAEEGAESKSLRPNLCYATQTYPQDTVSHIFSPPSPPSLWEFVRLDKAGKRHEN